MMRAMKRTLLVVLLALVSSGCFRSPIAMMPSTKPLAPGTYQELGPVEETDCLWLLFGILPISFGNDLQGAMRDAIAQGGGDALVQVTAETYYQNFLIVGRYCSIIQGVAVRSNAQPAPR